MPQLSEYWSRGRRSDADTCTWHSWCRRGVAGHAGTTANTGAGGPGAARHNTGSHGSVSVLTLAFVSHPATRLCCTCTVIPDVQPKYVRDSPSKALLAPLCNLFFSQLLLPCVQVAILPNRQDAALSLSLSLSAFTRLFACCLFWVYVSVGYFAHRERTQSHTSAGAPQHFDEASFADLASVALLGADDPFMLRYSAAQKLHQVSGIIASA